MLKTKIFCPLLILAYLFCLPGCVITYGKFPKNMVGAAPPPKEFKRLLYNMEGVSMAGGYLAIQDVFQSESPFQETESSSEISKKGIYVFIKINGIPPSVPSLIFGFISYLTLTLTPAWSTKGGANIFYEVYNDGALVKTFQYTVRRRGILWIVTLPLIWVNLFTYSEVDAFKATAFQFFEDARPLFKSLL